METAHIRDYAGKRIHLIGIGGSSMSGLAEMLMDQGYRVTIRTIRNGRKQTGWGFRPWNGHISWAS